MKGENRGTNAGVQVEAKCARKVKVNYITPQIERYRTPFDRQYISGVRVIWTKLSYGTFFPDNAVSLNINTATIRIGRANDSVISVSA